MSEGSGRQEMERRLIEKSLQDEAFRQKLVEDPKGTVEQELGRRLPEGVRVEAVEETQDTIYLVLPSASVAGHEGEAVSDQELQSVAGGGLPYQYTGSDPRYPMLECNNDLIDPPEGCANRAGVIKLPIDHPALLLTLIHRSSWKGFSAEFGHPIGLDFIHVLASLCATTQCRVASYASRRRERAMTPAQERSYARSRIRTLEKNPSTHSAE